MLYIHVFMKRIKIIIINVDKQQCLMLTPCKQETLLEEANQKGGVLCEVDGGSKDRCDS